MTSNILLFLAAVILPAYLGYKIAGFWPLPFLLRGSIGFFLGFGVVTCVYFFSAIATSTFSIIPVYGTLFIAILILRFFRNGKCSDRNDCNLKYKENNPFRFEKAVNMFLLAFIGIILVNIFSRALVEPVMSWDALATHAYKTRIFFIDQDTRHIHRVPHAAYPLYLPLAFLWLLQNVGAWHDIILKSFIVLSSGVFIAALYAFLRMHVSTTRSLIGVLLLLSSSTLQKHMQVIYLDLSLLIFNSLFFITLILWRTKKIQYGAILCGLLSGLTTFMKMEGYYFIGIHFIMVVWLLLTDSETDKREKIKTSGCYIGVSLIFVLILLLGKWLGGIPFVERAALEWRPGNLLDLIWKVLRYFTNEIRDIEHWNIVWWAWALSLLMPGKSAASRALNYAIFLFFMSYGLLAVLNPQVSRWLISPESKYTLPRFFLHFFPLAVMALMLNLSHVIFNDIFRKSGKKSVISN